LIIIGLINQRDNHIISIPLLPQFADTNVSFCRKLYLHSSWSLSRL